MKSEEEVKHAILTLKGKRKLYLEKVETFKNKAPISSRVFRNKADNTTHQINNLEWVLGNVRSYK